ncbi:UNVERIFIED_CONTAM: hypothetical protein FKN15_059596 [Acipenser sinensis]
MFLAEVKPSCSSGCLLFRWLTNDHQAFCLAQPGSKRVDPHPEVGHWYPGQPGYDPGVLDPEAPEEGPSAPPSGLLDTVSGYEGTPSEGDKIYPPPSDRVPKPENERNASVPRVRCATDAMGKVVSDAVNVMDGVRHGALPVLDRGVKVENIVHFAMDQDIEGKTRFMSMYLINGDKFFVDESALVYPIVGFPEKEICDASKKGNDEHMARFSRSMHILQQRQTIELIPLTQAFYEYKEQEYNYFVYGIENKVHAPKYPSSCSIL